MADFSFGGEGIMNAIAIQGQMLQRQIQLQQFQQAKELFPLEMQKAIYGAQKEQWDARNAGLKYLQDQRSYEHQAKYEDAVDKAVKSGEFKGLSPDQQDAALSRIALDAGLPTQAVEFGEKALEAQNKQLDAHKKQTDAVFAKNDIITSHLDGVRSQEDLNHAIDSAVMDLSATGTSQATLDQLTRLKGMPWQQVKKEYGQRMLNAQESLTRQANQLTAARDTVLAKLDGARTHVEELDAQLKQQQLDFNEKNGYQGKGTAATAMAQYQRVIGAGNQATQEAANIMRLPVTSSVGWLGAKAGEGLSGVTQGILTRELTNQDIQSYNVRASGMNRFVAQIEAFGTAQGIHEFSLNIAPQVTLQEGDTVLTKLTKMAEIRQNVTAGLETLLDVPTLSQKQREGIQGIITAMAKAIPFTVLDLDNVTLGNAKSLAEAARDLTGQKPSDGWGVAEKH